MPKVKESRLPVVSPGERDRLKARIDEDKAILSEVLHGPADPDGVAIPARSAVNVNTAAIQRRISRKEKHLEAVDPANRRLSGAQRQAASNRMATLEEWFKKHMISQDEMSMKASSNFALNSAYNKAVKKSMAQEVGNPEFSKNAQEYKQLARLMEPEDPELGNIERFRPERV